MGKPIKAQWQLTVPDSTEPLCAAVPQLNMTVPEVAQHLRVAVSTVRSWVQRGRLPAVRLFGRRVFIERSAVETLIEAGRTVKP